MIQSITICLVDIRIYELVTTKSLLLLGYRNTRLKESWVKLKLEEATFEEFPEAITREMF